METQLPNSVSLAFVEELYVDYLRDPESVPPDWRQYFQSLSEEIERAIADFAERAQSNQLTVDDLQGGTFTISNGGIYGSMLSTPIVNPPQSGVLGLHAIEDRPVARDLVEDRARMLLEI